VMRPLTGKVRATWRAGCTVPTALVVERTSDVATVTILPVGATALEPRGTNKMPPMIAATATPAIAMRRLRGFREDFDLRDMTITVRIGAGFLIRPNVGFISSDTRRRDRHNLRVLGYLEAVFSPSETGP
jgi:hypothetical protein